MRRAVALALVAGIAWAGWRYARAAGLGPRPDATTDLDRLAAWNPTRTQRELADLEVLDEIADRGFGRVQGDPLPGVPLPALQAAIQQLVAAGRAYVSTSSIGTTPGTLPQDRPVIAEAEARRAAAIGLLPPHLIDDAVRTLAAASAYTYRPADGRASVIIDIGPWGLPGYESATIDRPRGTPLAPRESTTTKGDKTL